MNQLENVRYATTAQPANHAGIGRRFLTATIITVGLSMVIAATQAQAQDRQMAIAATQAQAQDWQVDSQLSVARLSLGSNSNALQIGVARVSGEVRVDPKDLADSTVKIKISSDDTKGSDHAEMSFVSKSFTMTSNGMLIVTGDLSLTRIERSVAAEPNEAFAGMNYGDPVVQTSVRQTTLAFSDPRQNASGSGTMQVSGRISVSRTDFPQLLDALTQDNWPTQLVNDQKCEVPLTVGEDFSGIKCAGTVLANVSNVLVPAGVGEGYDGFRPAATPDLDLGVLALDLKLKETPFAPSDASSGTTTAARTVVDKGRGGRT
jgi:polyisoprenoid-binding protein YceI